MDHPLCAVADVSTRPHLLVDDVVIRFDIQHDSFRVSMSSAIAIRMLTVFRLLKLHTRASLSDTSIIAFCSITLYPASFDQSSTRSEFSRHAIDQSSTCFQIRMIDQSSTHFHISPTHSQTHSTRLPGSFVSRIMLNFDT